MKKFTVFLCSMLLFFLIAGTANAALIAQGDYVFDDKAKQVWMRNVNLYNNMSFPQQESAVLASNPVVPEFPFPPSDVVVPSWRSPWRVATATDVANLMSYDPEDVHGPSGAFLDNGYSFTEHDNFNPAFYVIGSGIQGRIAEEEWVNPEPGQPFFLPYKLSVVLAYESGKAYFNGDPLPFPQGYEKRKSLQHRCTDGMWKNTNPIHTIESSLGVWIVADATTIPTVPVPPTLWLLGSGLVGVVAVRRKLKK